jgi:PPOX class probable F420-dependent enzyme
LRGDKDISKAELDMYNKNSVYQSKILDSRNLRKTGVGVKTPVWFVQDGDTLFVQAVADSGKVKRIRNNSQVNITPCQRNGALLGDWVQAVAREVKAQEVDQKVDKLLGKKYGLLKTMFSLAGGSNSQKYTILEKKVS